MFLEERMAKSPTKVFEFLNELEKQLFLQKRKLKNLKPLQKPME